MAYELFEGSKFEGHTMISVIEAFKEKYRLEKLIMGADAGLLSAKNVEGLAKKNMNLFWLQELKTKQSKPSNICWP